MAFYRGWMLDWELECVSLLSRSLTDEDEGVECKVDDLMYIVCQYAGSCSSDKRPRSSLQYVPTRK